MKTNAAFRIRLVDKFEDERLSGCEYVVVERYGDPEPVAHADTRREAEEWIAAAARSDYATSGLIFPSVRS